MEPLISIITITYNAADTLPSTMRSVAEQTCRNFEHIIIDGASTDDTLSIARSNGTRQTRILSETDNGLYDAMNKGLRMAEGKYVIFLNAGDTFHDSNSLELYADAATSNPDIIYGDTDIVGSDGKFMRHRHLNAPEKLTHKSFSKGMLICHQAFMMRRELAPLYDTDYRFSADYKWTLECISLTTPEKCINLHTVTINYLEEGLTTKNHKASLLERFKIMREHYGLTRTVCNHALFLFRSIRR